MVEMNIDVIDRGRIRLDKNYMIQGNTVGTADNWNPENEIIDIPVWCLVIEHPDGTILWDTGSHHEAGDGHWPEEVYKGFHQYDADEHPLDDDLNEAGYEIDDIDAVIMTHLHIDHAGGLEFFDETDIPIYVHDKEIKFAYYCAKVPNPPSPAYVLDDFDHDLNWQIVHKDVDQYFEGIEFVRLPGHSPGLMGTVFHLDDPGTLIFTGDEVYQKPNYEEEIRLGLSLLHDSRAWDESLQQVKKLERKYDAADVIFGHDPDQFEEIKNGWP